MGRPGDGGVGLHADQSPKMWPVICSGGLVRPLPVPVADVALMFPVHLALLQDLSSCLQFYAGFSV